MVPRQGKWLVVFCDEINLPAEDKYGTQRVIAFIRHVVEQVRRGGREKGVRPTHFFVLMMPSLALQGGFWRTKGSAKVWVTVERTQFVGACNPPTDPGRVPLSQRFLRHAPVLLVDFPVTPSLYQIYGAFNRALLKLQVRHPPFLCVVCRCVSCPCVVCPAGAAWLR